MTTKSLNSFGHFAFAFLTVSLASGLVYGWPSLRRNLVTDEGSTLSEKTLGAVFTVGAWATQGGRFFFGLARDRVGTRISATTSLVAVTAGILGIALADEGNGTALAVSMFFVGLGSGSQLCVQPVACLFPRRAQGSIIASLSGAFQVSGLVFLSLTAITSERKKSFGGFSACLAVLTLVAARILPKHQYSELQEGGEEGRIANNKKEDKEVGDSVAVSTQEEKKEGIDSWNVNRFEEVESRTTESPSEQVPAIGARDPEVPSQSHVSVGEGSRSSVEDGKPFPSNGEEGTPTPHSMTPTASELIRSREYISLVVWFSLLIIPLQYYIATIGFQLERKGDDTGFYTKLFSIIYASSAAFSPLCGKIADIAGLGVGQALATILVAISLFTLVPDRISLDVQALGLSAYGLGRMTAFSMFFTNVGKRLGYANYGTLAGLGLLLSAIASLVQYPLISLAADGYETGVNLVCGAALLCSLPYCVWLGLRERRENLASPS